MSLVRIFGRDNGAGLARDMRLVAHLMQQAGHDVDVVGFGNEKGIRMLREAGLWVARGWRGRADLQVSLEHVYSMSLALGRRNVLIPNPEWFRDKWTPLLPRFDALLCKTRHAERIFGELGCRTRHIGFTSEDRLDAAVPREDAFLHLAGRSPVKGTEAVLAAWRRRSDWPRLVVLQGPRYARRGPPAANIEHRIGKADDAEVRRLQNAHRFHIGPSEAEGFGHCLMEAMSVGAITLTVDGEPMNELVDDSHGVLIPPSSVGSLGLAPSYRVDPVGIEAAVDRVLAMPVAEREARSRRARARFEANDAAFRNNFVQIAMED
ncbi:glycosyltransferase [Novilysobacter erysipheiresistens]|uniref:glycosyltransferase n=1 Tax=Novilysobacter erysipheiresistens TaxID=1749332 RepID=UPI002FC9775D